MQRLRDDGGSTMVVVLIVMLILSIGGLALAAVVMNTTVGLAHSRDTAQSRAAADAGMAALVAAARSSDADICSLSIPRRAVDDSHPSPRPEFEAHSEGCAAGQVTFESTGYGTDSGTTQTQATYSYDAGTVNGEGADMVFFGKTTFTHEVLTNSLDADLLSIVIPTGDFTCMAPVPANIVVQGMFETLGNCTVEGSVVAGGIINMTNGPDTVKGNVTASGAGGDTVRGTIGGDYWTAGGISFGWENKRVGGDVTAGGSVSMGSAKIGGVLTMPTSSSLSMQDGTVTGGVKRLTQVDPPEAPKFDSWFDYSYDAADWPGFAKPQTLKLKASGNGPGTCGYFNQNNGNATDDPAANPNQAAKGWRDLASLTAPTVVDARACSSGLSANNGSNPSIQLRTDVVFVGPSFDLTNLTINAAPGTHPKVWWIVPDSSEDAKPSCSGGAGNVLINHTTMGAEVTAMAYTPCVVNVAGHSEWTGAFYGGSFNYGGGLNFFGDPIVLPGMTPVTVPGEPTAPSSGILGSLISQRDVK